MNTFDFGLAVSVFACTDHETVSASIESKCNNQHGRVPRAPVVKRRGGCRTRIARSCPPALPLDDGTERQSFNVGSGLTSVSPP
eukprot:338457-Rhodomonas_salina.1